MLKRERPPHDNRHRALIEAAPAIDRKAEIDR